MDFTVFQNGKCRGYQFHLTHVLKMVRIREASRLCRNANPLLLIHLGLPTSPMTKSIHPAIVGIAMACSSFCMSGWALPSVAAADAGPPGGMLKIELPTDNRAFLDGHPEAFFMGVNRKDGGTTQLVWAAGQFGFVRAPMAWEGGIVFTQFHEGIDIAAVERDEAGEPRDVVHPIGAGTVVFCQAAADGSAYGRHVIIEHDWGCGPVFSLYAHLQRVDVHEGDKVKSGASLGMLGHSGTGIETSRAHLHLEIDLMLQSAFDPRQWRSEPRAFAAGRFDRLNLAGIDPARLFEALKKDASMTLPRFVGGIKPYFKVTVPQRGKIDLLRRYPWLTSEEPPPDAPSLEINFTPWGLPVKATASMRPAAAPEVTWVEPFSGKHSWRTGGLLSGSGPTAVLSEQGKAKMQILLGVQEKK
jgi:murein DD-endopeptidase MepM/ murein hydrolase activator NlpD